jgi:cell division protein FtsQ
MPSRSATRTRTRAFGGALGAAARGVVRAHRERGVPRGELAKPAGVRVQNPAHPEPDAQGDRQTHDPAHEAAPPAAEYAILVDVEVDEVAAVDRPEPAPRRAAQPEVEAEPEPEPEYAIVVDVDEPEDAGEPVIPTTAVRDTTRRAHRHTVRDARPVAAPAREPETVAFAPRSRAGTPRPRPRLVPAPRAPQLDEPEPLATTRLAPEARPGGAAGAEAPAAEPHPGLPVDPRIRARRIEVRRAEGRRRLRVLVVLVGLLTVVTALVIVVYSPMLDVERVDVSGAAPDQVAAIRTAAGVSRGDALLRVDTGRVEARLEQLPWVEHASVSRDLPDTVDITVSIRHEIAWVAVPPPKGTQGATTAALVDGTGRIVAGVLVAPAGLPQLVGLTTGGRPGTEVKHAAAAHVAAILPADLRNLASTLSVRHGLVTMGLGGGPEIRFGTADHLAAKGRTALAILGSLSRPVPYVDVRVPSAPVTGPVTG